MTLFFRNLLVTATLFFFATASFAVSSKPYTVILDWFINPTHGPILIAQEKGFFTAEGLAVNIVPPANPTDTVKMVAIGKADIGIGSDPELLLSINQALPLVRVGALIDRPLEALVVNAGAGVNTINDLKGKTVGYAVGGVDKVLLSIMLQHAGLTLDDVSMVNVHYNLVEALVSTRVDAITGALRNYEIPELRLQKFSIKTFYPENYGVPRYAELNYIINPTNKNDPRTAKFLRAIQKATIYIKEHPQRSWSILIAKYPELDNQLNELSWHMTYSLFADDPAYTDQKSFMKLITVMQDNHWLGKQINYQQCVVKILLPVTPQLSERN
jgi:putative hydroxymethylpyrimidine transport system substrate-binding protein